MSKYSKESPVYMNGFANTLNVAPPSHYNIKITIPQAVECFCGALIIYFAFQKKLNQAINQYNTQQLNRYILYFIVKQLHFQVQGLELLRLRDFLIFSLIVAVLKQGNFRTLGNFRFSDPLQLVALLCVCGACHSIYMLFERDHKSQVFLIFFWTFALWDLLTFNLV